MLADSAVVVEELWGQGIDYARLNHSMISFFNFSKLETAASRWSLVRLNASKVGKGLSKDSKAQKLDFQHWIEAKKAPFQKHREEEVKKKVWLLIGPLKPVGLLTQDITHTPKIDSECSFFLLGKLYDSDIFKCSFCCLGLLVLEN